MSAAMPRWWPKSRYRAPSLQRFGQSFDFIKADIFKRNRISRGTGVDNQILMTTSLLEHIDNPHLFCMCRHAEGEMYFSLIIRYQPLKQPLIKVARGRDFQHFGFKGGNFLGRSQIPYRSAVFHAPLLAPGFELPMLFKVEFQKLAMLAIGRSVSICGVRVRRAVFLGC